MVKKASISILRMVRKLRTGGTKIIMLGEEENNEDAPANDEEVPYVSCGQEEDDEDREETEALISGDKDDENIEMTKMTRLEKYERMASQTKHCSTECVSFLVSGGQFTVLAFVFALIAFAFCYDHFVGNDTVMETLESFGLVSPPKNCEGPWPECLWMTGAECAKYIRTQVPKNVDIEFMHKHAMDELVSEFEPNRVIIVVNDFDAVQEAPARGR